MFNPTARMKPRNSMSATTVETGSKTRMRQNVTRTLCMYGAILGPAQRFQATTEPSTNQPRGLARLTLAATVERNLRGPVP